MGGGELVKEVLQHFQTGLRRRLWSPEEAPQQTDQLLVLFLSLGDGENTSKIPTNILSQDLSMGQLGVFLALSQHSTPQPFHIN